jgi:hypothetical protein
MKTWTVKQMLAEKPCPEYTPERIAQLWAGRKKLSLEEILQLDIPPKDRIWVVWRPGVLTKKQTVAIHALYCGIGSLEKWEQNWLSGEDRSAAWVPRAVEYQEQVKDVLSVIQGRV